VATRGKQRAWDPALAQQVNKEMGVGASAMEMVACFDNTGILASLAGFKALKNFFLCHFLTQKVTKNFGPQSLLPIGVVCCWIIICGRLDFWCCFKPKYRWISLAHSRANLYFIRFSAAPKTVNPAGPFPRRLCEVFPWNLIYARKKGSGRIPYYEMP